MKTRETLLLTQTFIRMSWPIVEKLSLEKWKFQLYLRLQFKSSLTLSQIYQLNCIQLLILPVLHNKNCILTVSFEFMQLIDLIKKTLFFINFMTTLTSVNLLLEPDWVTPVIITKQKMRSEFSMANALPRGARTVLTGSCYVIIIYLRLLPVSSEGFT